MKRPLLLFAVSLICGITIAKTSQSYTLIFLLVVFFASLMGVFRVPLAGVLYVLAGMLVSFSLGACSYLYMDNVRMNKFKEFDGSKVVVTGFICSEPEIKENSVVYILKTESICKVKNKFVKRIRGKILLTTLKGEDAYIYEYGRGLKITGQMNLPDRPRNPGGFNYRGYLSQSGVSASVFSTNDQIIPLKEIRANMLLKYGLHLRGKIIKTIEESLPEQQAGLLTGMLIGYREGLIEEIQEVFSDSGLTHIMAVSGANIAFIVFPMLFILKKLRVNYKAANILVMNTLVLFVLITGFEPSVLRAVIMAETALLGKIINRETEVINSISLAAMVLLIYNPYNLFSIGFQLSFAATLSLVLFYKTIKSKLNLKFLPETVNEVIAATLAAQIGVLPISVYYFNKVSIISLLSNIIVIPLTGIITVLGCIMALLGQISLVISQAVGYVNCAFLSFVLFIAKFSADIPFAVIKVVTPSIILIILYYALIWFFLYYKPVKNIKVKPRYYLVLSLVLIVTICVYLWIPKNMLVAFLDVGEGDSIFIRTYSGKTVLIDGGTGDTAIEPILLDYGVLGLDAIIATHGHDDHINGLIPVMKNFTVKRLLLPYNTQYKEFSELLDIAEKKGINYHMLAAGDEVNLDNKTFIKVLNPHKDMFNTKVSLNNGSLVLKLLYRNVRILFAADIEEESEFFLVNKGEDLAADVLKVAHHGSESSSTGAFLEKVLPKIAVISVGRNTFGHPSHPVIEKLEDRGIDIYRTDRDGAVIIESNGNKIRIKKQLNESKGW